MVRAHLGFHNTEETQDTSESWRGGQFWLVGPHNIGHSQTKKRLIMVIDVIIATIIGCIIGLLIGIKVAEYDSKN